jgi:flavin reductase (DIM6/NTAB) family NADH-FMN oxidoreductase RutF/rubrerythrin
VVSSKSDGKFNAQAANTVFQITSEPARVAVGINKLNLTHEYIEASKVLTVTVLGKGNMKHIKRFGFQSGRSVDKFAGLQFTLSPNVGCPVIPDGVAYLECRIRPEMSVDTGTHTLYVADVVGGGALRSTEPITYGYYRANRAKPDDFVDDVDWNNVIAALNLEYGANRRYRYQIDEFNNPRLTAMLEGVMRTEGDHVDSALRYLQSRLQEKLGATGAGARGFLSALLHMRLNWEFEEVARATYSQFAKETTDPALRDVFTDQARSEMGHINIFKEVVESMESGQYPSVFFCPVCGWELDYGVRPQDNTEKSCPKCGAKFSLLAKDGNWVLTRI